jgi:hypothetical protein
MAVHGAVTIGSPVGRSIAPIGFESPRAAESAHAVPDVHAAHDVREVTLGIGRPAVIRIFGPRAQAAAIGDGGRLQIMAANDSRAGSNSCPPQPPFAVSKLDAGI